MMDTMAQTEQVNESMEIEGESTENQMLRDAEFYAEAFVENGLLFCGIIFNVINFVILRKLNMGENYRICLLALTTSDFLACVFGVIQLTIEGVVFRSVLPFGKWNIAAYVDYCLYYVYIMFMCTSGLFVIFIAIVRTYTLRKPMTAMNVFTTKRVKRACIGIFIVTFLLFLPTPIWGVWQTCFDEAKDHHRCETFFRYFPKAGQLKYYFYSLSLLFGPVVIILNILCLIALKRSLKRGRTTASAVRRPTSIYKMVKSHSKITRTLAIILVLDTLWILPTCVQYSFGFILNPEDTLFKRDVAFKIFDLAAEIMLNFRPTYNMFVFLVTNKEFRRQFRQLFCRYCYAQESTSSAAASDEAIMNNRRKMSSQAIIAYQVKNEAKTPQSPDAFLQQQNNANQQEDTNIKRVRKQISWRPTDKLEEKYEADTDSEQFESEGNGVDNDLYQRESIGVELRVH